jgi:hypothetical protein
MSKIIIEVDTDDVEYLINCLPETISVRGNLIASGDDVYDEEMENRVLDELEFNPWAWCIVKVTAKLGPYEGEAFLGGCSYSSKQSFLEDGGGYFLALKEEAREDLMRQLRAIMEKS